MTLAFSLHFTAALFGIAAALKDWTAAGVIFIWFVIQLLIQLCFF